MNTFDVNKNFSIYSKYQKAIMHVNAYIAIFITCFAVYMSSADSSIRVIDGLSMYGYARGYLMPLALCIIVLSAIFIVLYKLISDTKYGVIIPALYLTVLVHIVMIFFDYYKGFYILGIIPIFITSVYGNAKLSFIVYAANLIGQVIRVLLLSGRHTVGTSSIVVYRTFINSLIWITVSYIFVTLIIAVEKSKENMILESYRKIEDIKDDLEEATDEANTDGLTKLYNFRFMEELVNTIKDKSNVFYAMMDIDNFKQVNDKYDHLFGDEVLVRLADILREVETNTSGYSATACRWGGEEFGILFQGYNEGEVYDIVDKVRRNFRDCGFRRTDEHFTISAGIGHGNSLVEDADHNLYKAKKSGKNKVVL